MKHLYIPVSQFTFLEMVTNTVLRDTDSPRARALRPTRRSDMESTNCRICGRLLTNPKSVERGIGPICWSHRACRRLNRR